MYALFLFLSDSERQIFRDRRLAWWRHGVTGPFREGFSDIKELERINFGLCNPEIKERPFDISGKDAQERLLYSDNFSGISEFSTFNLQDYNVQL